MASAPFGCRVFEQRRRIPATPVARALARHTLSPKKIVRKKHQVSPPGALFQPFLLIRLSRSYPAKDRSSWRLPPSTTFQKLLTNFSTLFIVSGNGELKCE